MIKFAQQVPVFSVNSILNLNKNAMTESYLVPHLVDTQDVLVKIDINSIDSNQQETSNEQGENIGFSQNQAAAILAEKSNSLFIADKSNWKDNLHINSIIDEQIEFHTNQFFISLVYHFLDYFLIGPLVFFVAKLFGHTILMNNFQFTRITFSGISQATGYVMIVLLLVLYYGYNFQNIFPIEGCYLFQFHTAYTVFLVYFLFILIFIRIIVISVKYGTFSSCKFKLFQQRKLTLNELNSNLMFGGWLMQEPAFIEKEIIHVMIRENIDFSQFQVGFLREPCPLVGQRLHDQFPKYNLAQENLFSKGKQMAAQVFNSFHTEFQKNIFSGATLVADIFENVSMEFCSVKYLFFSALGISIPIACVPFVFRKIEKDILFGEEPKETALMVIIFILTIFYLGTSILFFIHSPREFQRNAKALAYLVNLLAFKKLVADCKKRYPTINFFCGHTLLSWNNLFNIVKNYGASIKLRIDVYTNLTFSGYLLCAFISMLSVFDIINTFDCVTNFIIGTQIVIVFCCIICMLVQGIKINSYQNTIISQLEKIHEITQNLYVKRDFYFKFDNYQTDNPIYGEGIKLILKFADFTPENKMSKIRSYLRRLLDIQTEILENVRRNKQDHPQKVLGFEATYSMLKTILVTVVSVIFALVQYYLQTKDNSNQTL